jgi:hypothetical protein
MSKLKFTTDGIFKKVSSGSKTRVFTPVTAAPEASGREKELMEKLEAMEKLLLRLAEKPSQTIVVSQAAGNIQTQAETPEDERLFVTATADISNIESGTANVEATKVTDDSLAAARNKLKEKMRK